MAPPPELIDDVTAEVLLRLPPDEPEHLVRASLVCKPWLRLLSDPAFLRRYRAFHGAPPLLGLLHRLQVVQGDPDPRVVPTTAVPLLPYPDLRRSRALDCRHGRVLLHVLDRSGGFLVWDPVTGDKHRVPDVDTPCLIYSAAVICAVSGCDHLDCHGGPFRVIFVFTHDYEESIQATVYSSETGVWGAPASLEKGCFSAVMGALTFLAPYVQPRRGALIGDEFYFTLRQGNAIIKYDWGKNCLSLINPPSPNVRNSCIALVVMEDSSLGFACIHGSRLKLWSRKVNSEGAAEWVECRAIELETKIPGEEACVVGFAEGVDVIFVSTNVGLFTIELKSGRARKVDGPGVYFSVLPYMSFYTPGNENIFIHRTPPLLGLLQRRQVLEGDPEPRLVPTTALPLSPNPSFRRALDCRHGRVLLHADDDDDWYLVVWDPATGDQQRVPEPNIPWLIYTSAVLCAVSGCDHLDCHGGPFLVVFMATDERDDHVKASVYSSETGVWSTPVSLDKGCESYAQHRRHALNSEYHRFYYTPYVQPRRVALVGDEIYFTLRWGNAIVKYDWGKNRLSMINPPTSNAYYITLMLKEDSSLGFAYIEDNSLYLWSRKVNSEGAAEWVQCKVIELEMMIPVADPDDEAIVVGFAEGVGVIFVSTGVGLFTIKLNSGQVKKVDEPEVYFSILPYMSFCTPDCGISSSLARPRTH